MYILYDATNVPTVISSIGNNPLSVNIFVFLGKQDANNPCDTLNRSNR